MSNLKTTIELSEEQKYLFGLMENTKQNLFITGKAGTGDSGTPCG